MLAGDAQPLEGISGTGHVASREVVVSRRNRARPCSGDVRSRVTARFGNEETALAELLDHVEDGFAAERTEQYSRAPTGPGRREGIEDESNERCRPGPLFPDELLQNDAPAFPIEDDIGTANELQGFGVGVGSN